MRIQMTLYVQNHIVAQGEVTASDPSLGLSKQVEYCLLSLCRQFNAPIPLWLQKNTKEFASFHQTLFFPEQFDETVSFDRMQLKLLER